MIICIIYCISYRLIFWSGFCFYIFLKPSVAPKFIRTSIYKNVCACVCVRVFFNGLFKAHPIIHCKYYCKFKLYIHLVIFLELLLFFSFFFFVRLEHTVCDVWILFYLHNSLWNPEEELLFERMGVVVFLPAGWYRSSWRLIRRSLPVFVDEKYSFSVYRVRSCVFCACSRHVCDPIFLLFFLMHTVLLIFMYFSRCKEKLYFGELQRFVWNWKKKTEKLIKMRSF